MQPISQQITSVGKMIFDRHFTDMAGGNISCRQDESIYITPTGAGQKYLWNLSVNQIICAPIFSDELFENPLHSKESISHLLVYRTYPHVKAIIHAHPFHVLPFCAAGKPMKAVLKSTQVYGSEFEMIAEKPMYSQEQGDEIVERLRGKDEVMKIFGAALLMPKHGVFIAAPNLYKAMDCLERMSTNAWCILAQKMMS
jgi:L-fuculose-phosphate aldolase